MCTRYPRFECTRLWVYTQVFKTRQQKNLASLWARCSLTASLLSSSLLKLSKSLMPQLLVITFTRYSRLVMSKLQRIGSLSMPSEFFYYHSSFSKLTSVHQKVRKCANCLLSRSCHHCDSLVGAIIGPRPIRTRECVQMCASMRVLVLACRGCLLHARVNVQATRVTSSLFALVCQVACDLYCMLLPKLRTDERIRVSLHIFIQPYWWCSASKGKESSENVDGRF